MSGVSLVKRRTRATVLAEHNRVVREHWTGPGSVELFGAALYHILGLRNEHALPQLGGAPLMLRGVG